MQKASKIWIALFAATLTLLLIGGASRYLHRVAADAVYPFENGMAWLRRGVSRRLAPFFRAEALVARVQTLEDEVARLHLDAALLAEVSAENAALRRQLGLPPETRRTPLVCQPLSWGGALGWWQSVRINRGRSSGVARGDAVVTPEGLVGRVRTVYGESSDVELITDPNARVACSLDLPEGVPSVRGILQGCGWRAGVDDAPGFLYVADPLRLDFMPRDFPAESAVAARVRVVTSGLSDSLPGGIAVGWLASADLGGDGLYRTGKVVPAVDFANLGTMFVLVAAGGGPQ